MKSALFLFMAASLTSSIGFAGNFKPTKQIIDSKPVDTYTYTVKSAYDEHGSLIDVGPRGCKVLEEKVLRQIRDENQIYSDAIVFVSACTNAGKGFISFPEKKSAYFSNSEEGL